MLQADLIEAWAAGTTALCLLLLYRLRRRQDESGLRLEVEILARYLDLAAARWQDAAGRVGEAEGGRAAARATALGDCRDELRLLLLVSQAQAEAWPPARVEAEIGAAYLAQRQRRVRLYYAYAAAMGAMQPAKEGDG